MINKKYYLKINQIHFSFIKKLIKNKNNKILYNYYFFFYIIII